MFYSSLLQMNRPYGAVDVAANLKGAVPKAATQKILIALAEKGELVQKIYGSCQSSRILITYMRVLILNTRKDHVFCCKPSQYRVDALGKGRRTRGGIQVY